LGADVASIFRDELAGGVVTRDELDGGRAGGHAGGVHRGRSVGEGLGRLESAGNGRIKQ